MSKLKALFARCAGGLIGGTGDFPQFLILGLSGAGKTTLLYRLKIGMGWGTIKEDMKTMRTPKADGTVDDPGYHYEEFSALFKHGIWEVPGTDAIRHIWKMFYQTVKIHGILFVVDSDMDEASIEIVKKHIHQLMNEDELRQACFCVIINQKKDQHKGGPVSKPEEHVLRYKFGLHNLHPTAQWRTKEFVINILDLKDEFDKQWTPVLEFARDTLMDPRGYGLKL
eukprot:TRINITY_DN24450_c0_g1_i1.p1 TRINITY_DN24450_c0_g1~~TRINITY_DN24450_c0_g1_i1.p1  ORF type:complete len:225 (+),score=31.48 TRINITY_DN24450_c0_g1_i1:93-767(+)